MHFWRIQPLVHDLSTGKVSERQGMLYYLASTLIALAQTQYSLWWGPRSGWLFHLEFTALVVITYIGISQCWKANKGDAFVFRAICLSVPAGVRVSFLSITFGLLLYFNAESLFDPRPQKPERAYAWLAMRIIGFAVISGTCYTGMALLQRLGRCGRSLTIIQPKPLRGRLNSALGRTHGSAYSLAGVLLLIGHRSTCMP